MRARSTAASVCPARTSTPPSRARSGNTCPGLARSTAFVRLLMATTIVRARSAAEMPVVVPFLASMPMQKAVSNWVEFCWAGTCSGICSSSSRAPVIGMQMRPRP